MPPASLTGPAAGAARATADALARALTLPPPAAGLAAVSPRGYEQSLSQGAAGVALLHAARARRGLASWEPACAWLTRAAAADLRTGSWAGLWHGVAAVAFAVSAAAPPGTCQQARSRLDQAVSELVRDRLEAARARLAGRRRPARHEYDLVLGLTGLGAYLLYRRPGAPLLRQVLDYLVRLSEPVPADDPAGLRAPGWWTLDLPASRRAGPFRAGHADLGMAHGIAGPLALLALARRRGITASGHDQAMDRICRWLDAWRLDGPGAPWWPERVTYQELAAGRSAAPGPPRPSWCYGTPGLARAQQLAGLATGNQQRRLAAEATLTRCLADDAQLALLTDPAICHGWAGVLLTTWHAAADSSGEGIGLRVPSLADALVRRSRDADRPGLVDGRAGIALALYTVAGLADPGWEACLLIS
jgi:hypothetical protein